MRGFHYIYVFISTSLTYSTFINCSSEFCVRSRATDAAEAGERNHEMSNRTLATGILARVCVSCAMHNLREGFRIQVTFLLRKNAKQLLLACLFIGYRWSTNWIVDLKWTYSQSHKLWRTPKDQDPECLNIKSIRQLNKVLSYP